ncbi:hypothetical protein SCP_1004070 [Sparassis crispa]|uniref:Set2 Rpb1 interacting domain-containing protein n=1 Tax=Sparassis crispa TaxID=139825 RepID=A0A401GYA0_9APHY|nr:hypothetical protein SCP_1004070 [Sparassis crispa]GBE87160.1 hypothetical protein SCP_1004070 [Sparassis crispa]
MLNWPLLHRNKVEDSKVYVPVQACSHARDRSLEKLSQKPLASWDALEYAHRIPKRVLTEREADTDILPSKRLKPDQPNMLEAEFLVRPLGRGTSRKGPSLADSAAVIAAPLATVPPSNQFATLVPPTAEDSILGGSAHKGSRAHKKLSSDQQANEEKRLLELIVDVVVKCMSEYRKAILQDILKKLAEELTLAIAEVKKWRRYKHGKLDSLPQEKSENVKKFAEGRIAKVRKLKVEKAGEERPAAARDPGGGPVHLGSVGLRSFVGRKYERRRRVRRMLTEVGQDLGILAENP